MANPPILPPQIFCNNDYLGDYDSFFMAKEMELSFTFFKQSYGYLVFSIIAEDSCAMNHKTMKQ